MENKIKPTDVYKEFKEISDSIVELLTKKNNDYGDNNLCKFGLFGILVRLSDKLERLSNYIKYEELMLVEEGINDLFIDIAGYSINALRLLKNGKIK